MVGWFGFPGFWTLWVPFFRRFWPFQAVLYGPLWFLRMGPLLCGVMKPLPRPEEGSRAMNQRGQKLRVTCLVPLNAENTRKLKEMTLYFCCGTRKKFSTSQLPQKPFSKRKNTRNKQGPIRNNHQNKASKPPLPFQDQTEGNAPLAGADGLGSRLLQETLRSELVFLRFPRPFERGVWALGFGYFPGYRDSALKP